MLEQVMRERSCSLKVKLTVKGLVSFGLIVLAVLLPQLVHLTLGQAGGVRWLPMYLPVLLAGCLLGVRWGMGVGVLSPVVSFALTSLWGDPMPAAARLPFMMAELCVFAAVSGIFQSRSQRTAGWHSPPCSWAPSRGERSSCSLPSSSKASRLLRSKPCFRRSKRGFRGSSCRRQWCRFS